MEGIFNANDKFCEDDDFVSAEQVSWTNNPLFCVEDSSPSPNLQHLMSKDERLASDVYLKSVEFETESGFSESTSIFSALSSPARSISPHVSFSEDENDLTGEIADNLHQTRIMQIPGNDVNSNVTENNPKQIISSKGTVRGVKNRVRENILHFLSSSHGGRQKNHVKSDTDSEPNPDRGKVILYTTSLGFVRATQYECKYVKRIFHNLMVRFDERDLFVHPHFKNELQKKLGTEIITLPQIFIDGKSVGGAKDVEQMIENGTVKEALENVEKVSHAQACPTCGGYKFISCGKCSGSGKSKRTRFSREISSLKCSSCTKGIISCPECNS